MRRWVLLVILILAMAVALAACDGDDGDKTPPGDGEGEVVPDGEATEEPPGSDVSGAPIEPGLQVRSGLTVLRRSEGVRDDTGYFYAEVRNDTGEVLEYVETMLTLLDAENLPLSEVDGNTLLTDIPPDQTFYVGAAFSPPEGYADSKRWIWYSTTEEPALQGYFDLPATVASQNIVEGGYYAVRGTAENTSGVALAFPVIHVILIGPDDNLVGMDYAVVKLDAPDGTWAPGEQADFEVIVGFVAVEPELVTDVIVMASGYAVP